MQTTTQLGGNIVTAIIECDEKANKNSQSLIATLSHSPKPILFGIASVRLWNWLYLSLTGEAHGRQ